MIRGGGAPNKGMAPEPLFRAAVQSRCSDWTRRPGASPLMRMAASWSGPHEAHRIQARGAMTRARWRTPLGLARNRLPAQQTRRNAAAEPLNTNLDIDVPIQTLVPAMLDRGHHVCLCRGVAGELIRDHDTRGPALLFQQLAEQALGGLFVPPDLDQDVEHDPILVDGPPEPVLLAADHQAHFVEVPLIARAWQPTADLVGEALAELARPLAHGFVAHLDATRGQHLFDHAQAQGKAEVEPDGVADDLARKAVAGVGGLGCGCHASHLPVLTLSAKPRPKLTVPADALRDDLRAYVIEHLGDDDARRWAPST